MGMSKGNMAGGKRRAGVNGEGVDSMKGHRLSGIRTDAATRPLGQG